MKSLLQATLLLLMTACALTDSHPRNAEDASNSRCKQLGGETFNAARLDALFNSLERDPAQDLRGIVVTRRGCIKAERYFNGDNQHSLRDIRSATKSITSTLVGIAIQRRLVPGLDETIANVLPPGMPVAQKQIRVSDLLTMRSGLDADDDAVESWGRSEQILLQILDAADTRK